MQLNKILNYQKHIKTIFRPLIDYKISGLKRNKNYTPNLIISLTTYQKRIKDLKYTLYSLFNQTIAPEKIILNISPQTNLPKELDIFIKNGLIVEYCEDIGPYTKLIPTLIKYPNKVIVTADDDIYYPTNWLEKLYSEYKARPELIHCHRAHRIVLQDDKIKPYEQWEKHISCVKPSYSNFLTGVGGVLYPPNCFTEEVLNQAKFKSLAPFADDIWFWSMAILAGRKINVIKQNITYLQTTNIFTQLGFNNLYAKNKLGGNDTQLTAIVNEYPEILKRLKESQSIKIVFDASSLYVYNQKNGKRAGIYNVASNILTCFNNDDNCEITLHTDYKYFKFIKNYAEDFNYKLIDRRTLLEKVLGNIFWQSRKFPHKIKYSMLYFLRVFDTIIPSNIALQDELNKYSLYFSPFEGIPKEAQNSNIKSYQFIHDVIPLLEGKKLPPYHWGYSVFKNINNKISYFTNSEYTKQDFLKQFPTINNNNVTVSYLGHNKKEPSTTDIYQKYSIPRNKKYILSLCAIGKRKNLDFAIKNFETFINENKINDLVFVLAGSCWANYKKEISKSFSSSNIIFTGYIDDEDIPSLYSSAIGFIYPSLYEGFGLPIIEAMTYNTPVITSNRTSLPEVAGDAAILINPSSEEDLKNAIEKLYFNRDLRTHLIEQGKQRVQFFSWDNCYNIIKKELLKSE